MLYKIMQEYDRPPPTTNKIISTGRSIANMIAAIATIFFYAHPKCKQCSG
ncbi:hypothetical protein ACE1CC_19380 [Aerosakkonemataceae cyanobacterium BLCC-F46]|uniref:Uncharacterized protein n=1 Tax=Floridaenema aerugineum BLCC-F46 TaxID=3153654 RepID=A0ABV4X8B2_9CYAN